MAFVTIQVLDGFERGRVFDQLPTPVSIGREEDNTIQLNDELVSRFHAKIQENSGRLILTDLDSTNGTRVNGHPIHVRVLRLGDQLAVGRSVLLYGSQEEIAAAVRQHAQPADLTGSSTQIHRDAIDPGSDEFELAHHTEPRELFPLGPPELPRALPTLQMAQFSDLLAYVHEQIGRVMEAGSGDEEAAAPEMRVEWVDWQRLVRLQMQLAVYLRELSEP